ncbi:MAG: hypothetical protein COB66_02890 [Coxiella sp. (in: Bacteria)]|nr:MAG: hypothetical protein COB66_02890 [Coxiella sp. (in: g-proteobacteria)]
MGLFSLKWTIMVVIFATSVGAGFTTLHIANKYKKLISLGEALASGIFIGAAIFHLLPDATAGFLSTQHTSPLVDAFLVAAASFLILMCIEQFMVKRIGSFRHIAHIGPLIATLSIHAFITGIALGISTTYTVVISLLVAIMAHKAFELFALVINLHRQIKHNHYVRLLFLLFSCITPLGIFVGFSGGHYFSAATDDLLTTYFNAICAGTFIYIATIHSHHRHHPRSDGYQKYEEVLASIAGVAVMGILAIWI